MRLIIGLAATILASTMMLTGEAGPAMAVPPCKLPAHVPSPPAPIAYNLTCLPWENIPGTDLQERWSYASSGNIRYAWVTIFNPPINSAVPAGDIYDEFVDFIEIARLDKPDNGIRCSIGKWVKTNVGLDCLYSKAVGPQAKFEYDISYLPHNTILMATYHMPDVRTP